MPEIEPGIFWSETYERNVVVDDLKNKQKTTKKTISKEAASVKKEDAAVLEEQFASGEISEAEYTQSMKAINQYARIMTPEKVKEYKQKALQQIE